MSIRKNILGLTAIILAAGAVFAFVVGIIGSTIASDKLGKSGDDSSHAVMEDSAKARSDLPMEEIKTRLEEQGYTKVYEVEQERGVYEVKALHPKLGNVELYVDPSSGEILKREMHN